MFCLVFRLAQLYRSYMNRKKDIEQLFRQHYAKMYNLARCILSDDDESKDISLQVTYNFNAKRSKYKGTGAGNEEKSRL